MYLPSHFQAQDPAHALALIRQYPFASLITTDAEGFPFASHVPVHLASSDLASHALTLSFHLARGNPQVASLQQGQPVLLIFLGPQAYMSPSVYPDVQRVPTWSYLAVHVRGRATTVSDANDKDRLLKQLIADHEPEYASQWRALPQTYQERMLSAIEAFELTTTDWQCKIKLNQHRPESHAAMHAAYAQGNEQARSLAQWMVQLGLVTP